MALEKTELFHSRNWEETLDDSTFEQIWEVTGTTSQITAANFLWPVGQVGVFSGYKHRLLRKRVERFESSDEQTHKVVLTWERWPENEVKISYDLMADTEHITEALEQQHFGPAADIGLSVNQTTDSVEGLDILAPKMVITAVKMIDRADFTLAYLAGTYKLEGRTNDALFGPYDEGVLLFGGAAFRDVSEEFLEGTYQFIVGSIFTDRDFLLSDGSTKTVSKDWWEYFWAYIGSKEVIVGDDVSIQKTPKHVHVAKVYPEGDFDVLNVDLSL